MLIENSQVYNRGLSPAYSDDVLLENRTVRRTGIGGWHTVKQVSIWIIAAILFAYALYRLIGNPALQGDAIAKFLMASIVIQGLVTTVVITILAAIAGLVGGLIVALMRMSANPLIRLFAIGYLTIFRAVPLLVQILIWYNLGTFFPELGFGIPFTNIGLYGDTNVLLSPFTACLVALGLNQAAYMGEIIRGGLLSVQKGQIEAAVALGMTSSKAFWRVIAPQAARSIIPPLGNDIINLLKATSLVSVVGVGDLMTRVQGIYASNYQVIPLLIVASIWYLTLTLILSWIQTRLERRYAAGSVA